MQIREYHRRHPAARVIDANDEYEQILREEPQIEFSGEVSCSSILSFLRVCGGEEELGTSCRAYNQSV